MRFQNSEERTRHPQASLIPESLWINPTSPWNNGNPYRHYSDIEFPDQLIALGQVLQNEPDSLLEYITNHQERLQSIKKTAWCMIALGNTKLDLRSFRQINALLNISDTLFFSLCALIGNKDLMEALVNEYAETRQLQQLIGTNSYDPFRSAASHGHLSILHYLAELAPNSLHNMISARDYYAFRWAASNGHLHIFNYLAEQAAPNNLRGMTSAFHWAVQRHDDVMVYFLLTYPDVFAYAESAENEEIYEDYVQRYIQDQLNNLRLQIAEETLPLSPQQAKQFFYLAIALIRRQAPIENLRLVLALPEVAALAHQEVTPGQPNELLRLAARLHNIEASEYLLSLPLVQREAEAHNFYEEEYQNFFFIEEEETTSEDELFPDAERRRTDLQTIAQDEESSMVALSEEENQRFENLKNHYLKKDKRNAKQILKELRSLLVNRYEADPATITVTGSNRKAKSLSLPCTWEEFTLLPLSRKEKKEALKAYYQNKNHTAWRFLAKPNPWLHPEALFVKEGNLGQWSYFEDYMELIAVLFLAAKDKNIPGINGYTINDRITQFIDELALIGRAHNWDSENDLLTFFMPTEEHDNLEGDNPSCFSGIKRRLFQSVQGHSLLSQLTSDMLQQELREFVWKHFQEMITEVNRLQLCNIWKKSINLDPLTNNEKKLLSSINIPEQKRQVWFETLRAKYGDQINNHEGSLSQKFKLSSLDSHFIRFSYLELDQLLQYASFQKGEEIQTTIQSPLHSTTNRLSDTAPLPGTSPLTRTNSLPGETNAFLRFFNPENNAQNNNNSPQEHHPLI